MKWLLRLAAWATVLAIPSWFVSHGYQQALARAAALLFAVAGQGVEITDIEVMAPFDLAIYAAMCLSSLSAPWPTRRRALLVGIPVLAAIEILTVVLGIAVYMIWPAQSHQLETGLRLTGYVIESIPWVSASVVWLLFLGAWELRLSLAPASPRRGGAATVPARRPGPVA